MKNNNFLDSVELISSRREYSFHVLQSVLICLATALDVLCCMFWFRAGQIPIFILTVACGVGFLFALIDSLTPEVEVHVVLKIEDKGDFDWEGLCNSGMIFNLVRKGCYYECDLVLNEEATIAYLNILAKKEE